MRRAPECMWRANDCLVSQPLTVGIVRFAHVRHGYHTCAVMLQVDSFDHRDVLEALLRRGDDKL
eukprot:42358-Eustigmatos_ZCMA.PRE.1